jgi:hypothetical protein
MKTEQGNNSGLVDLEAHKDINAISTYTVRGIFD